MTTNDKLAAECERAIKAIWHQAQDSTFDTGFEAMRELAIAAVRKTLRSTPPTPKVEARGATEEELRIQCEGYVKAEMDMGRLDRAQTSRFMPAPQPEGERDTARAPDKKPFFQMAAAAWNAQPLTNEVITRIYYWAGVLQMHDAAIRAQAAAEAKALQEALTQAMRCYQIAAKQLEALGWTEEVETDGDDNSHSRWIAPAAAAEAMQAKAELAGLREQVAALEEELREERFNNGQFGVGA